MANTAGLKRKLGTILIIIGLFIAVVGTLSHYRSWFNQNQGFAIIVLTFALVVVTATYTWITQKILRATNRVELTAHLTGSGLPSNLLIANLGATHVLILGGAATIEKLDHEFNFLGTTTLAPGQMIQADFRPALLKALEEKDLPPKRLHQRGGMGPGHPTHDVYYYEPPTMYTVLVTVKYHAVGRQQPDLKIKKGVLFTGTLDDSYAGDVEDVQQRFQEAQRQAGQR